MAIIGLISSPAPANAGLLSFVAGLFDNNSADEALPKEENYKYALLKAALNLDPNPAKGGGDITVVGGVALLPAQVRPGLLRILKMNRSRLTISVCM